MKRKKPSLHRGKGEFIPRHRGGKDSCGICRYWQEEREHRAQRLEDVEMTEGWESISREALEADGIDPDEYDEMKEAWAWPAGREACEKLDTREGDG